MAKIGKARRGPDWLVFMKEFRDTFHTTGSVLPSSRRLAERIVGPDPLPRRTLEVGPGTGAFTDLLMRGLGPSDSLTLVELNDRFVEILARRLEADPNWAPKAARVELRHGSALDLPASERYSRIICGLPFFNFDPELVRRCFEVLVGRLEPGGTLSFFQYWAVRQLKSVFVGRKERDRLRAVAREVLAAEAPHEVRRSIVWLNFPPAVVHHVMKKS